MLAQLNGQATRLVDAPVLCHQVIQGWVDVKQNLKGTTTTAPIHDCYQLNTPWRCMRIFSSSEEHMHSTTPNIMRELGGKRKGSSTHLVLVSSLLLTERCCSPFCTQLDSRKIIHPPIAKQSRHRRSDRCSQSGQEVQTDQDNKKGIERPPVDHCGGGGGGDLKTDWCTGFCCIHVLNSASDMCAHPGATNLGSTWWPKVCIEAAQRLTVL